MTMTYCLSTNNGTWSMSPDWIPPDKLCTNPRLLQVTSPQLRVQHYIWGGKWDNPHHGGLRMFIQADGDLAREFACIYEVLELKIVHFHPTRAPTDHWSEYWLTRWLTSYTWRILTNPDPTWDPDWLQDIKTKSLNHHLILNNHFE